MTKSNQTKQNQTKKKDTLYSNSNRLLIFHVEYFIFKKILIPAHSDAEYNSKMN